MARGIKLKSRINMVEAEGNHRLRVWVEEATDVDPNIFVYQRFPQWPGEDAPRDVFVAVASVADMAEFPPAAPSSSSSEDSPFFRLRMFDVVFRSVYDLNNSWALVKQDVADLVRNLDRLDEAGVEEEFVAGDVT